MSHPVAKTVEELMVVDPKKAKSAEKTIAAGRIRATLHDMAAAIRLAEGNLTKAAELLEVSRPALKRKIDFNPALQKVLQDVIEQKLDKTEDRLFEQVDLGNVTAITFTLRTLGKHRGFSEKTTIEHEVGDRTRTAAALIQAMRETAKEIETHPKLIELKEDEWKKPEGI